MGKKGGKQKSHGDARTKEKRRKRGDIGEADS